MEKQGTIDHCIMYIGERDKTNLYYHTCYVYVVVDAILDDVWRLLENSEGKVITNFVCQGQEILQILKISSLILQLW